MPPKYRKTIKFRLYKIKNMDPIECAGFIFSANFDSGNILKVELVNKKESRILKPNSYADEPDYEFNVWTKPDCAGTQYENCNRSWFYFGIKCGFNHALVKINIVDLSKQTKMYSQGMVPVTRVVPSNKGWERIRDRVTFVSDETSFILSFRYFTPDNIKCTQYFAFTYPYTYSELQSHLLQLDQKHLTIPGPAHVDDIYYVRECVCKSLEGRRVDLITISSYHNITFEKETRLKNLFPDKSIGRPFKFLDKKVIFVSARVHPGETPASFVFNGFLNLLLQRDNMFAIALRRMYVFKLIPFLNPDGVYHGHYRTDTRGINLNRFYLNPSVTDHPSVYAARSLIRYYHHGVEKPDDEIIVDNPSVESLSSSSNCSSKLSKEQINNSKMIALECVKCKRKLSNKVEIDLTQGKAAEKPKVCDRCQNISELIVSDKNFISYEHGDENKESGLFLYIDLHGHASKKGIFMYGNHFKDQISNVECMLLPKIMSINNANFHFYACNFTERNMYLKDRRDGLSREGSGRVAVLKLTGLVRSYTLECNYNTGRMVNSLPAPIRDGSAKPTPSNAVPPKFTPQVYEETGRALGPSILDLTGDNPNSRIPNSEFRTLNNMREWLKWYLIGQLGTPTENCKAYAQQQQAQLQMRPGSRKIPMKTPIKPTRIISSRNTAIRKNDRKENVGILNKTNNANSNANSNALQQPSCSSSFIRSAKTARSKFTTPTISSNLKTKESSLKLTSTSGDYKFKQRPVALTKTLSNLNNKTAADRSDIEILPKQESKRLRTVAHTIGMRTPRMIDNRIKLREICLLKTEFGKKYVAKYDNPTTSSDQLSAECTNDNELVIEWKDNSQGAEILPKNIGTKQEKKTEMSSKFKLNNSTSTIKAEAKKIGCSLKKIRMRKPLRRLTTTSDLTYRLIKNKKRKKKKAKFI